MQIYIAVDKEGSKLGSVQASTKANARSHFENYFPKEILAVWNLGGRRCFVPKPARSKINL